MHHDYSLTVSAALSAILGLAILLIGADLVAASAAPKAAPAPIDKELIVLSSGGGDLLKTHLLGECTRLLTARREAVAKLTTADEVLQRQQKIREAWLAAVGPFPERTPLEAKTTGTLDREGYRIEKVLYASRPGHHVTGNLYIPKQGQGPFPAVLVPCGHSLPGKAAAPYQSICLSLVANGFVVLCYDPIGQGERCQLPGEKGTPAVWGTTEHTLTDIGARLVGRSTAHYRIWDGLRSIDYLVSRPEVDPNRIGCTGNSGGGTMTSYLMATDDRIAAAAPSCYLTSLERLLATIGAQDGEQNITGQIGLGIDHADYINMRAPKPTLMCVATKDFFDIDGAWAAFREAKRLYGILGFGEQVDIFEYPDTHGFTKPRREAAMRWMRRWLQHVDEPTPEPPIKLNAEADLAVTPTGQVVRDLKDVTVWDLNLAEARRLAPEREAFWKKGPTGQCLAEVRRLAAVRPLEGKPPVRLLGTVKREGYAIEKLVIERPGEVPVPALLFLPEKAEGRRPAVIYVDGRGKAADAAPAGPIEALVRAGTVVMAIDVRGFGETAALKSGRYLENEYPLSYAAIMLGRPLLGQRVEDVFAAASVLADRPEVDAARLSVVGVEAAGPIALHAAALDERISEVTLRRSIESWMNVVATPMSRAQLQNVVPGALTRYDLSDLVRAIAPRPVRVEEPLDPAGKPRPAP